MWHLVQTRHKGINYGNFIQFNFNFNKHHGFQLNIPYL